MLDSFRLNPLGIGESFEQNERSKSIYRLRLNPLGIGESFELVSQCMVIAVVSLNPLGIGESFELNVRATSTSYGLS